MILPLLYRVIGVEIKYELIVGYLTCCQIYFVFLKKSITNLSCVAVIIRMAENQECNGAEKLINLEVEAKISLGDH